MISLFTAKKVEEKSNKRKTVEVGGSDVVHVLQMMIAMKTMMMAMLAMSNKIVE